MSVHARMARTSPVRFFLTMVSFILAYIVMLVLPYDKVFYKKTEPLTESTLNTNGYPAGEGIPVCHTIKEINAQGVQFTIETDVKNLEPMGIYYDYSKSEINMSFFSKFDIMTSNNSRIGQFYLYHAEDGNMLVLLDDRLVDLPEEGTVKLPAGRRYSPMNKIRSYITNHSRLSYEETKFYGDMASNWRSMSHEAHMATAIGTILGLITFVVCGTLTIFISKIAIIPDQEIS